VFIVTQIAHGGTADHCLGAEVNEFGPDDR
jgi:hypothetical protein